MEPDFGAEAPLNPIRSDFFLKKNPIRSDGPSGNDDTLERVRAFWRESVGYVDHRPGDLDRLLTQYPPDVWAEVIDRAGPRITSGTISHPVAYLRKCARVAFEKRGSPTRGEPSPVDDQPARARDGRPDDAARSGGRGAVAGSRSQERVPRAADQRGDARAPDDDRADRRAQSVRELDDGGSAGRTAQAERESSFSRWCEEFGRERAPEFARIQQEAESKVSKRLRASARETMIRTAVESSLWQLFLNRETGSIVGNRDVRAQATPLG